jgi:hypothetical protein
LYKVLDEIANKHKKMADIKKKLEERNKDQISVVMIKKEEVKEKKEVKKKQEVK